MSLSAPPSPSPFAPPAAPPAAAPPAAPFSTAIPTHFTWDGAGEVVEVVGE